MTKSAKGKGSVLSKLLNMGIIFVFAIACFAVYLSEPHGVFLQTIHTNSTLPLPQLTTNISEGVIGWTSEHVPENYKSSSYLGRMLGKRWDAYVFVAFNYYIVEIVLVDLTYASQITISYSTFKSSEQIISQHMVPLSLEDDFWGDEVRINTDALNFNLTRNHTNSEYVTQIQFKTMSGNKTLTGHLVHFMNKTQCMTFLRPYSSIKCLHGMSEGSVRSTWSHYNKQYRVSQSHDDVWVFSREVAVTMYDGFRGSGYEWYWVWAMGVGWTQNIERGHPLKQQRIRTVGLSLGVMYGMEQDFMVVEGKLVKLQGVKYAIDESKNWQLLHFTYQKYNFRSTEPQGWFEFNVTSRHHYREDMWVIQKDMHKAYGIWRGEVKLPDGTLQFNKVFGLVEVSKSRF